MLTERILKAQEKKNSETRNQKIKKEKQEILHYKYIKSRDAEVCVEKSQI